jgi:hypothetical protein
MLLNCYVCRGNRHTGPSSEITGRYRRGPQSIISGCSSRNWVSAINEHQVHSAGGASEMGESVDTDDEDGMTFWMDLDKLGSLFSHQGSNFYLRIGALC